MSVAQPSPGAVETGPGHSPPTARPPSGTIRPGRGYSRFVVLMKLLLPLIAVALAVMVVVWPQFRDRPERFRLDAAGPGPGEARGQLLTNARYTGLDNRNRPYTITALSARQRPDDAAAFDLERPMADVTTDEGAWLALWAPTGVYDRKARVLTLRGGVSLFHDDGYELHTETARIDFAAGGARGDRPVEGRGPTGWLKAAGFRFDRRTERILFTGNARLLLYPAARGRGG